MGQTPHRAVGVKQALRAVQSGRAIRVYVAKDAEQRIVRPLLQACQAKAVPVIEVENMARLGAACGIAVGAAAAAVLSDGNLAG